MFRILIGLDNEDYNFDPMTGYHGENHIAATIGQHQDKETISRFVNHTDVFVYLIGPNSYRSPQIQYAHNLARRLEKPILYVLVHPVPGRGLPPNLIDGTQDMQQFHERLAEWHPNTNRRRPLLWIALLAIVVTIIVLFGLLQEDDDDLQPSEPTLVLLQSSTPETVEDTIVDGVEIAAAGMATGTASPTVEETPGTAEPNVENPAQSESQVGADANLDEEGLSLPFAGSENDQNPLLFAFFDANPDSGTVPLAVTFSEDSDGDIVSYAWDLNGDGVVDSNAQDPPVYTYTALGEYDASLTVMDAEGNSNTHTVTIYVDETASESLLAGFSVDNNYGVAPLTVSFTNESTGNIASYTWDFDGDGRTDSTLQNPAPFTYAAAGDYEALLRIRDANGNTDTYSTLILVDEVAASDAFAQFSADPDIGEVPLTVTFTDESEGDIASYAWDFDGDDTTDSTAPNPAPFIYNAPGTYEARLTITDSLGNTNSYTLSIIVDPVSGDGGGGSSDILAWFSVDNDFGPAPLDVLFFNEAEGDIAGYAWDFNSDGVVDSTSPNPPAYTYTQPGEYEAQLTVTAEDGTSDTYTYTIFVEDTSGLDADIFAYFIAEPDYGVAPLTVTFMDDSDGNIVSYAWDFNGDGVVDSTTANPSAYTYTQVGEYTAVLTITDAQGNTDTTDYIIFVDPPEAPFADFDVSEFEGTAPLTVSFFQSSTGEITSYAWDLNGDGVVDSNAAAPPQYTYTQPGNYEVRLTVTGSGGTDSFSIVVNVEATVAAATATPSTTSTATVSPTTTVSPTITATPTNTVSPTSTMTSSSTVSPTNTVSPTITMTSTSTATATFSPSPSNSPQPTETPQPSATPTSTPTPTATSGNTPMIPTLILPSMTPSITSTPSSTATPLPNCADFNLVHTSAVPGTLTGNVVTFQVTNSGTTAYPITGIDFNWQAYTPGMALEYVQVGGAFLGDPPGIRIWNGPDTTPRTFANSAGGGEPFWGFTKVLNPGETATIWLPFSGITDLASLGALPSDFNGTSITIGDTCTVSAPLLTP